MRHLPIVAFAAAGIIAAAVFGLSQFQQAGVLHERLSKVEEDIADRDAQIAGLDSQLSELAESKSELESDVAYWRNQHQAKSKEYDDLGAHYDSLSEQYGDLQQSYGDLRVKNQQLAGENVSLMSSQSLLQQAAEKERTQRESAEAKLAVAATPPYTVVQGREIKWAFKDSKGNGYNWEMPIDVYRNLIDAPEPATKLRLQKGDGSTVIVRDHTRFVDDESFAKVVDEIYDNAASDKQFLYELWFITSQLTTYSTDIGEDPRWALETFTEAGGDCEDLVILIASMLKSSEHTDGWKIQMVYFDADNPLSKSDVDHVALYVETDEFATFVESTNKEDGLQYWKGTVNGWYFDL